MAVSDTKFSETLISRPKMKTQHHGKVISSLGNKNREDDVWPFEKSLRKPDGYRCSKWMLVSHKKKKKKMLR